MLLLLDVLRPHAEAEEVTWLSGWLHDKAHDMGFRRLARWFWRLAHGGPCQHDREMAGRTR